MLTVVALVAIAVGMAISVGSVVNLWIDSRKKNNDNDNDRSSTDVE
jgi:hypothetical protein